MWDKMDRQAQLDEIRERIRKADLPLKDQATNLVFGKGNPEATIMFIGEAAGRQEDLQGIPFVGAAGKELDRLLHNIGLSIDDVYIANILKYRPPNNRNPTVQEIKAHTPYLIEQVKVIKPRVIVTLGNFATKFVLAGFDVTGMNKIQGIGRLHGKAINITVDGLSFKVLPVYHPAAILYNRELHAVMEKDFKILKEILEQKQLNT